MSDDKKVIWLCAEIMARRRQMKLIPDNNPDGFGPVWYMQPLMAEEKRLVAQLVNLPCQSRKARLARAQALADGFFPLVASVADRLAHAVASDMLQQR